MERPTVGKTVGTVCPPFIPVMSVLFVHRPRYSNPLEDSTRELFYNFFECWVFLPHDLIKPGSLHSGLLQLLIGPASFYALVLLLVSN
jgi:hypothetical protein